MEITVQVSICNGEGQVQQHSLATLARQDFAVENIGLKLSEAKALLENLQQIVVSTQAKEALEEKRCCGDCQKPQTLKDYSTLNFKTLFGTVALNSPRYNVCTCAQSQDDSKDKTISEKKTVSPLRDLLSERIAPELLFLESKWASLVPYAKAAELLKDVLPLAETHSDNTVRNHVHHVAQKQESQLPEDKTFIQGSRREWEELPTPNGPFIVGIDGGFVRSKTKGKFFEVVAGKSILTFKRDDPSSEPESRCFGLVQTHDKKSKQRLYDVLSSQGMQANQQITFLSDGGESVRKLQVYLSPEAEHILDWFHVAMRFTVLKQQTKGLSSEAGQFVEGKERTLKELESAKHYLWHGNVESALLTIENIWCLLDSEEAHQELALKKLRNGIKDLLGYLENNSNFIVNYGERYRNDETITTSFVESTINQVVSKRFVKKQQMQWSKEGAHLLLQVRTKVLDNELENDFRKWYPDFQANVANELALTA